MSKYITAPHIYQQTRIDITTIDILKEILARGEKCDFSVLSEFEKFRFVGDNETSQLRIHISSGSDPRFVVSVVWLVNQRQGTMTKIFKALSRFCRSNGIQIVEIQSVSTEEMRQWCKKNAFSPSDNGCWLYNLD